MSIVDCKKDDFEIQNNTFVFLFSLKLESNSILKNWIQIQGGGQYFTIYTKINRKIFVFKNTIRHKMCCCLECVPTNKHLMSHYLCLLFIL